MSPESQQSLPDTPLAAISETRPPRSALEPLVLLLVLLAVLGRVWCSPADALDHLMAPDGDEYIAAAYRLVHGKGFNICIAGTVYPTRYVPGFSLLLSPIYLFAGQNLGAGIYFTTALALAATWAAFQIGRELSGSLLGATMAALAIWCEPTMAAVGRSLQSDGPAMSLALLGLYFSLRARCAADRSSRGVGPLIAAGCFFGVATAVRPLLMVLAPVACVSLLFPGTFRQRNRTPHWLPRLSIGLAAVCGPTVLVMIATGLYQLKTFGSFSRTGYAFWVPLPYDFPDLTFALRYRTFNWFYAGPTLLVTTAAAAIGLGLLAWARRARVVQLSLGLLAGPAVLSGLHLFYLWPSTRFHILYFTLALLIFGSGVGAVLQRWRLHALWAMPVAVMTGVVFLLMPRLGMPVNPFTPVMREVLEVTPPNALIVTDITPSYFDIAAEGREQYIATRIAEYASKFIAPRPLAYPAGRPSELTWPTSEHRQPLLRLGGAIDAVDKVALEDLSKVEAAVAAGRPVFLDIAYTPDALQDAFVAKFQCTKVSPSLVRVLPKSPATHL